jgi:hypothetical protein
MKTNLFLCVCLILIVGWSCSTGTDKKGVDSSDNIVLQQPDGTLTLRIEKAVRYNNDQDPASNTAEWNVAIEQPGRYNVWLSSATRDTTDLSYTKEVKVNLQDNQLETEKKLDKIIRNSEDVRHPYYRADTFMGSFFVQEPGDYYIQVISDKIPPEESSAQTASSRLMAVFLTPIAR